MSKKIPSWVKNVLMFGGMPAIALLISNNVAAQNQTTTTRTDSVVITQSYQDSISYEFRSKSNNIVYSDTSCTSIKVLNSGTSNTIQTSQSAPVNNDNKNTSSNPCTEIKVLTSGDNNNKQKTECFIYISGGPKTHER